MATDKSEPRVGIIFTVGIGAVVTLICLRAALSTYFNFAVQAEDLRKIGEAKPVALMNLRADEKARLAAGDMPIDKAMDQMVRLGRRNAGAEVMPLASKDMAPLEGWTKMPAAVPTAMMAAASAAPAPAADAGAPLPTKGAAEDGGAPKAAEKGPAKKTP